MGSDSPPTTLTTADLDRLEALLASAAPGKWQAEAFAYARATDWIEGEDDDWFVHDGSGSITGPGTDKADAQAIVALHNMAPALIALARRALQDV